MDRQPQPSLEPVEATQTLLDEVALSWEEYEELCRRLGRRPTFVELGLFGSLWSEHCGYKNSKPLLRIFQTSDERLLVPIGEENAGVVDIGDGLAVAMKVESHNHPSAIEPFQGAATGVGGIVRDIFAMGARPIAILDSLRFGPLSEARNRYLFTGVVGGIGAYGNCLGIPTVGGEVYFDPSYSGNPLVNAMCVGIVEIRRLFRADAGEEGNLLMLVGADTGRDGIHGASGLASRTFEAERELRPTVQVGNPFMEKLLLEACLELTHTDHIVGLQDLGAAGLASAAVECASKAGSGIEIDVALVPRREAGMDPYEVMLSESQERMLVVVKQGHEDDVRAVFAKWDLRSDVIGHVTGDGLARIRDGDRVVAEAPIAELARPPLYTREAARPQYLDRLQHFDLASVPELLPAEADAALLRLLSSPNIASKEWIYRQYDHQVLTNTVVSPGGDAAVLRIKGTGKGLAVTTDGNGRYCYLDPFVGGAIAVAEAARNVVCTGAVPIAVTDCLNFGNPEREEVYYSLREAIRGMAQACHQLRTPVTGGNVSLYNETQGQSVLPTPVVGMVGLIADIARHCQAGFRTAGDVVFLLDGNQEPADVSCLGGSQYLETVHGTVAGPLALDLEAESRVQRCCLEAIEKGVLRSAHDCSDGGLAVALAEKAIIGGLGFSGELPLADRLDVALFGEKQSRIVVSLDEAQVAALEQIARRHQVKATRLGVVGGQRFAIEGLLDLPLEAVSAAWRGALEESLTGHQSSGGGGPSASL